MTNRLARNFMLTAAAGLFCSQLALAKIIATDEFEEGSTRPVSVLVLPSQVELVKARLVRTEAQVEESGELEVHLDAAIAEQFRLFGYETTAVSATDIAADGELQELVIDANRRFGEFMTNFGSRLSKARNVRRRDFNLGDEIKLLAAGFDVDALAFVRMQIVAPAAGVRALNFGVGGERVSMAVTIVDGTSGDVEAYLTLPAFGGEKMFGGHDDIVENPELEMANYAEAVMDDLYQADPSLRAESSDEDVISDLESLLE